MIGRYRDGVVPDAEPDPESSPTSTASPTRFAERLDAIELTAALDQIWQRVRRLNRYVQDQEPWQLAKDEAAGRTARPGALHAWPRACGWSRCCSTRSCPNPPSGCWRRWAARTCRSRARASGAAGGGAAIGELGQLFPRVEAAGASAACAGPWSTPTVTSTTASRPTASWSSAPARPA